MSNTHNNETILNDNNDDILSNIENGRSKFKMSATKELQKNICKRTTKVEKFIAGLVFIAAIVFIVIFITGDRFSTYKQPLAVEDKYLGLYTNNEICHTPGCIHAASKILNFLDQRINPCDDFYKFSCGNFIKSTMIPDDKTSVNVFTQLDDILQEQVRKLISEQINEADIKPFKLAKSMFNACINTTAIENLGLKPIRKITEKLGGWPVVQGDSWNENDWNWDEAVIKLRNFGISVDFIIDFSVVTDVKNTSKRMIDIDQSQIGLERAYLINSQHDKIFQSYFNYMVDIAVLFGASPERAKHELKESLEFEVNLAKISLSTETRRNSTILYNAISVNEIQAKYSYLNWLKYFNSFLMIQIDGNEIINESVPDFFKELENLLKQTSKRTIANYLLWRVHHFAVPYSTEKLRNRELAFMSEITGRKEREPRWKECVRETKENLNIAVGALYVRNYFKEDSKTTALLMVDEIRKVFRKMLTEVDWMDDTTRKSAILKLDKMKAHIGYPDELMDDNKIIRYYESLELDSKFYFESLLNIIKFKTNSAFNKLRKIVNKTDWESQSESAVVNAFYNPILNSIRFPAGILQGGFFSASRPNYLNYGAIGYVIGHEITHGFDDQGRQFDVNGNLIDWWADATKKKFTDKAKCIIEQYQNYFDISTGLKLNGVNTQGENIADNGGVKEAYIAYTNWVRENKIEPKLPGLQNYTSNQMFWISAAQNWCSNDRSEYKKNMITTGSHPPPNFRVLGPLSNMKEFSDDFKCILNSKMNPKKKCQLW